MFIFILKLFLLALITEAITEIVIHKIIFEKIREKIKKTNKFFEGLFNCGACLSVWIAIILCYLFDFRVGLSVYDWTQYFEPFLLGFAVHRLATWFHVFYMAIKQGPTFNLNTLQNINNIDETNIDVDENENEEE